MICFHQLLIKIATLLANALNSSMLVNINMIKLKTQVYKPTKV